jgi:hypothetical protein
MVETMARRPSHCSVEITAAGFAQLIDAQTIERNYAHLLVRLSGKTVIIYPQLARVSCGFIDPLAE